jgi:ferredoxin-NADP reductase
MNNSNVRKTRYKESITKYGIYPLLSLLKEYEDYQEFEECKIIQDALKEYIQAIKDKNKKIAEQLSIPTHLNQIDNKMYIKMNLDKSDKVRNVKLYINQIKKLVNEL